MGKEQCIHELFPMVAVSRIQPLVMQISKPKHKRLRLSAIFILQCCIFHLMVPVQQGSIHVQKQTCVFSRPPADPKIHVKNVFLNPPQICV